MKVLKAIVIILVLCSVTVFSLSCASKPSTATPSANQTATVQRGNLVVDITASGNLALSHKTDLAFETAGTAVEVLVAVGDSVEEKQVLARLDTSDWQRNLRTLQLAVIRAEISLKNAQQALEKAEEPTDSQGNPIAPDPLEVDMKELGVEVAEADLEDAQEVLDEAKNVSPEVKAPFAGFIANVNVAAGDEVKKGTVAMTLADPTQFETQVLVNEMDILNVKPGTSANVTANAMTMLTFPAKVTWISPTGTVQSGVVNYKVKVQLESPQPAQPGQSRGTQPSGAAQASGQTSNLLKEGFSVTVRIILQEKNNVLLVPNKAITTRSRQTFVQVLKDNVVEERSIKTGITNGQYTEVTDGLSEGEKVVIRQATVTSSTTTPGGGGGIRIPGIGGFGG